MISRNIDKLLPDNTVTTAMSQPQISKMLQDVDGGRSDLFTAARCKVTLSLCKYNIVV